MSDWLDTIKKWLEIRWPLWRAKKDIKNLLDERAALRAALNQCRIEYGMEDAFIVEALNWKPKD